MKKINVLYDASALLNILENSSVRSGIFFTAYNILLELLKREEFNIYLYARNTVVLKQIINNYKEFSRCKIYKPVLINYIDFVAKRLNKRDSLLSKLLCISLQRKILNRLTIINHEYFASLNDIDVYFSPAHGAPKFIAKNKRIKKYTVLHDVIPLTDVYKDKIPAKWFTCLIDSINPVDKYFSNSEYTKSDFIKYVPKINPENITPITFSTGKPYYKIDDKEYINRIKEKYGIPAGKKYIYSLCSIDPRKNLIFAIKNFLRFVEKNNINDLIFVLGGGYFTDFIDKFNNEMNDLNLRDKIIYIGYVEDEDMSALYSGAEMFLFPSLYEGFGLPVLEAMQCGLPVICSNVTSLPEVIGDCGIQIDPHSDDDMVKALEKMYYDRNFRDECINKGLKRAKMFTWKKGVDVIVDTIKKDINYEE